jgi:2-phosphoglycerate kinase
MLGWKVLLIGGSSGTGKTMVAQQVARRFGASVLQADDIRLALQRITTPVQQPALHYFVEDRLVWQRPAEALVEGWAGVANVVSRALEIVIANHIADAQAGAVVIEGDGILPSMAAQDQFAGLKQLEGLGVRDLVRSVFLFEPEEQALFANMRERRRGFRDRALAEQHTQVRGSWLYGQWLRQAAQGYNLPVLTSRPWSTLVERVLAVIESG